MTDRDWTKTGVYTPDPGAVVEVNDTGGVWCGNDSRPFVPKSVQLRRRAAKAWKRYLRTGIKGGNAEMILATVRVSENDFDLGKWQFSALPNEGQVIGITLNEQPAFYRVDSVFHLPVMFSSVTPAKVQVPRVTVMVHALLSPA